MTKGIVPLSRAYYRPFRTLSSHLASMKIPPRSFVASPSLPPPPFVTVIHAMSPKFSRKCAQLTFIIFLLSRVCKVSLSLADDGGGERRNKSNYFSTTSDIPSASKLIFAFCSLTVCWRVQFPCVYVCVCVCSLCQCRVYVETPLTWRYVDA